MPDNFSALQDIKIIHHDHQLVFEKSSSKIFYVVPIIIKYERHFSVQYESEILYNGMKGPQTWRLMFSLLLAWKICCTNRQFTVISGHMALKSWNCTVLQEIGYLFFSFNFTLFACQWWDIMYYVNRRWWFFELDLSVVGYVGIAKTSDPHQFTHYNCNG